MKKLISCLVLIAIVTSVWGCGSTPDETATTYRRAPNIKIRVVDVSNSTNELFDVDVIGMLWSSLEESLRRREMLWRGETAYAPLTAEADILRYQKGSAWYRWALPMWGKTYLNVKLDIQKDGRLLTTVETEREISFGDGTFTRNAWRKIFAEVADDLINQAIVKL